MTYLDPDILDGSRPHPRACNDGGGRNGNPTLLEAIVVLMGSDRWLRIDFKSLEALGAIVGHASAKTTMSELHQMAELSYTIWMLPAGADFIVWPTAEGEELLAQRRAA